MSSDENQNLKDLLDFTENNEENDTIKDENLMDKVNNNYKRIIGNYSRKYSFEEFVDDLSKNQRKILQNEISDKIRKIYTDKLSEAKTQLEFYQMFDNLWDKLSQNAEHNVNILSNEAAEKLDLIQLTVKNALKYNLEWMNINGFIAKKVDDAIYNKMCEETNEKLTEQYRTSIGERMASVKNNLNNNIAYLCCVAYELFETFEVEQMPEM